MFRRSLIIAFLLVACAGSAQASDGFVCIADQSTGFIKKGERWETTTFELSKYTISSASSKDKEFILKYGFASGDWVLKYVGIDMVIAACVKVPIGVNCGSGDFILNEKTLRFIKTDGVSYLDESIVPKKSGLSPTVSIEIGTCSKF